MRQTQSRYGLCSSCSLMHFLELKLTPGWPYQPSGGFCRSEAVPSVSASPPRSSSSLQGYAGPVPIISRTIIAFPPQRLSKHFLFVSILGYSWQIHRVSCRSCSPALLGLSMSVPIKRCCSQSGPVLFALCHLCQSKSISKMGYSASGHF